MEKMGFRIKFFGNKKLLLTLAVGMLVFSPAVSAALGLENTPSSPNEADRQEILSQTAQKWVKVGAEQYKRGSYRPAEKSFLRAMSYQEYLTATERQKLSGFVEKTHKAVLETERISVHIETADELIEKGQLIKARAHLVKVKDSGFLTKERRRQIAGYIRRLGSQISEQKKEINEIYNRSVELYQLGRFEKARGGFIKVAVSGLSDAPPGRTAENYLVEINDILTRTANSEVVKVAEAKTQLIAKHNAKSFEDELFDVQAEYIEKTEPGIAWKLDNNTIVDVAEPVDDKTDSISKPARRNNILRSYARAIVSDAVAKAQDCVNEGKFYKAKEAVDKAERLLSKYQTCLEKELFIEYTSRLKELTGQIATGRKRWLGSWNSEGAWKL